MKKSVQKLAHAFLFLTLCCCWCCHASVALVFGFSIAVADVATFQRSIEFYLLVPVDELDVGVVARPPVFEAVPLRHGLHHGHEVGRAGLVNAVEEDNAIVNLESS